MAWFQWSGRDSRNEKEMNDWALFGRGFAGLWNVEE